MSGPNGVVHLLRHGEVFNPHKLLYGRMPGFVLSAAGERMAVQAADALADRDIVAVISSPLTRAQQTATPLAERVGLPILTDERLVEPWNVFEGLTVGVGDGSLRRPRYWRHLVNPFRPSWGEPYVEVVARMNGAVIAAAERADGHEVCFPPASNLDYPARGGRPQALASAGSPAVRPRISDVVDGARRVDRPS